RRRDGVGAGGLARRRLHGDDGGGAVHRHGDAEILGRRRRRFRDARASDGWIEGDRHDGASGCSTPGSQTDAPGRTPVGGGRGGATRVGGGVVGWAGTAPGETSASGERGGALAGAGFTGQLA